MSAAINAAFKARIAAGGAILMPGAANALSARIIADMGFEAVYLTGAGVNNMFLGMPDLGFVGLSEMASHAGAIRDATDLPLVVDADTGFGNALNVAHTVRVLERAGASVIQIEDQAMPKRCGHFEGKTLVTADEMAGKIKAAVDARQDPNLQILARTDARGVEGLERALERAHAYAEAGADMLFVEAPVSEAEILALPKALPRPQLVNVVIGGKTPALPFDRLDAAGFALVLYANAALQGAILGMQNALARLKADGRLDEDAPVASFADRQRLVGKDLYDALDRRYGEAARTEAGDAKG
ncbi:isocitrate lyase/PEP mutase family protein [Faunimonas sp. B44]|uniref:isocitrate lyase/PEP mutase family protein n=1 Tax=Faunimonas sp. B44 TaxID=3461493 RepID=UPI0040447A56